MNSRKPNWEKWKSFKHLQIWQIIALSFDIDPDKLKRGNNLASEGLYSIIEGSEFEFRLETVLRNYNTITHTTQIKNVNRNKFTALDIRKFVDWADFVNLEIPSTMKSLFSGKSENLSSKSEVSEVKTLSKRTENNYLRLLIKLAGNIKGFDSKKPFEAAKLIIENTDINLGAVVD